LRPVGAEIESMLSTLRFLQGQLSAHVIYPLVERYEKRTVRSKVAELSAYYQQSFEKRKIIQRRRLSEIVDFAVSEVPYYRDLAADSGFDSAKLEKDPAYLNDLPYLTKEIIREHGSRLTSRPIAEIRHYDCKTGGSTGLPCHILYDQESADYASAVTLFCRARIGKRKSDFEIHFASRFPDKFPLRDRLREEIKCIAMNRGNIFFDKLDDEELETIWQNLRGQKARLVHAHPSTMYVLACYIERTYGKAKAFDIFESSGELLEESKRAKITEALCCHVVDRYGLAEFGVIAYQTDDKDSDMLVLDSEGWGENAPLDHVQSEGGEIVFTGFRNRLMPLIRYRTGDCGTLVEKQTGQHLTAMTGRMHDMIPVNGTVYPTHYVQDVLDRVGGVLDFQINLDMTPPRLLIVPEEGYDQSVIEGKVRAWWGDGMQIAFGGQQDIVRVGWRSKFRHVVGG